MQTLEVLQYHSIIEGIFPISYSIPVGFHHITAVSSNYLCNDLCLFSSGWCVTIKRKDTEQVQFIFRNSEWNLEMGSSKALELLGGTDTHTSLSLKLCILSLPEFIKSAVNM